MRLQRKLIVPQVIFLITYFFACSTLWAQQSPPPAPVITHVSPDRLAPGDILTLTGEHFCSGGLVVSVDVCGTTLDLIPDSDTSITLTLPDGIGSGPVSVTTITQWQGQTIEQTSNQAKVLVVWDGLDFSSSSFGTIDNIFPGDADDLYFLDHKSEYPGTISYNVEHLTADGSAIQLYSVVGLGYQYKPNITARNPTTGSISILRVSTPSSCDGSEYCNRYSIVNMATGASLVNMKVHLSTNNCHTDAIDLSPEEFIPVDFGFDANQNILVAGIMPACYSGIYPDPPIIIKEARLDFWRFPINNTTGSDVLLLPDTAILSVPISLPNIISSSHEPFDLTVARDGSAMCRVLSCSTCWNVSDCYDDLFYIPPSDSSTGYIDHIQSPADPPQWPGCAFDNSAFNTMTVNCENHFFIMSREWDLTTYTCTGPIYEVYKDSSSGTWIKHKVAAAIGGSYTLMYSSTQLKSAFPPPIYPIVLTTDGYGDLYELGFDPSTWHTTLHRFTPSEMINDTFYDGFDCCSVTSTLMKEGDDQNAGVGRLPAECGALGPLKVKIFSQPVDPISGDGSHSSEYLWSTPTSTKDLVTAQVLLGQAPKLEVYGQDSPDSDPVRKVVKWKLVQGSESVNRANPKGLYPHNPEILFMAGGNSLTDYNLRFQSVHTGTFTLDITTVQEPSPRHLKLKITINAPAHLGDYNSQDQHHQYDDLIVHYADVWGIPPQYIKSQIYEESGHDYNPDAFRYEPYSYDYKLGKRLMADANFTPFRMPGGVGLTDADRELRTRFSHIASFDISVKPPILPYTCNNYAATDTDVYLYDIFAAWNGWQRQSPPWKLYNPNYSPHNHNEVLGPCHTRQNWYKPLNYYAGKFYVYCGYTNSKSCNTGHANLVANWFQHNSTYPAQLAVCSSFGLMQVMYPTAIQTQHWRKYLQPVQRDPCDLFIPYVSISLGVSYDADKIESVFNNASKTFNTLLDYETALKMGFRKYNRNGPKYKSGQHIRQGYRFMPY